MWDLWWTIWQWYRLFSPQVLISSPVNIIPPTLHIHLYLHVTLTRRTNGRSLGTFLKQCFFFFSEIREHWIERHFQFVFQHRIKIMRAPCLQLQLLGILTFSYSHIFYQKDKRANNKKLLSRWPPCLPPETTCVSHLQHSPSSSSPPLFLFTPHCQLTIHTAHPVAKTRYESVSSAGSSSLYTWNIRDAGASSSVLSVSFVRLEYVQ